MPLASTKTLIANLLALPLAALAGLATAACSSSSSPAGSPPDSGTAADSAPASAYAVTIDLALAADSSGQIPLSNVQGNQSVAPSQVTGKMVYAVLFPEGMGPPNDMPIDNGGALIESNLKAKIPLSSKHPSGSYEVAMVISLSGWTPGPTAPAPQDLVAFTNPISAPPPADGVPYTGKTIRFQVGGADTVLPVDNTEFIEYGSAAGGPPPAGNDGGPSDAGAE
jgi:hypothetical protein